MNRKITSLANADISSFKINVSSSTLKILYYKNKEYFLPFFVILVNIFIFLIFLLPQIQELSQLRNNENVLKLHVEELNSKIALLSSLDKEKLNSDLDVALSALPMEKDYASILYGISRASERAGVTLQDYNFSVGDLSTSSAQQVSRLPKISINLSVIGDINRTKQFIKNLYETFPISSIVSVQLTNSSSSLVVDFYFKLSPYTNFNMTMPLKELSSSEKAILETINSLKGKSLSTINFNTAETSSSASLNQTQNTSDSGSF